MKQYTKGPMPADDLRHGTANGYGNLKCRCEACRAAWAERQKAYMHRTPEQQIKNRDRSRAAAGHVGPLPSEMGLLTASATAAMFGVSRSHVCHTGLPVALRHGKRVYYDPAVVKAELLRRMSKQYGPALTALAVAEQARSSTP